MCEIILDIETTGINTFKDKIITLGIYICSDDRYIQLYSHDEKSLLDDFIRELKFRNTTKLIGWKISRFDIPFIKARLLVHSMHEYIKYLKHIDVLDLADVLENEYVVKGKDIYSGDVLSSLNIRVEDKLYGGDVPSLYKVGDFDSICEHNYIDLLNTKSLYEKVKPIL